MDQNRAATNGDEAALIVSSPPLGQFRVPESGQPRRSVEGRKGE